MTWDGLTDVTTLRNQKISKRENWQFDSLLLKKRREREDALLIICPT